MRQSLMSMVGAVTLTALSSTGVVTAAPEVAHPAPRGVVQQRAPIRPPSFAVERTRSGEKVLYRIKAGALDRLHPIATKAAGWQPGPMPALMVTCNTFKATQAGNTFCGVNCSDNTIYKMSCSADIFANGFDNTITE